MKNGSIIPNKVTIKYKGQSVDCYGAWKEDSNAIIVGDWDDGSELEEVFADGAKNWTEAVHKIIDAPVLQGCKIYELSAC